jgi:hypothetical protein
MEIRTFDVGGRTVECARIISEKLLCNPHRRAFILPIPSTRDKVHITGCETALSEMAEEAGCGDIVAGYGIPDKIKDILTSQGASVYDGCADEEFLALNAEVTARGTLGYLLCECDKDLPDLRIGIIGYGRIGSCLLRYLLFLGAQVTLFTRREEVAVELCEAGVMASTDIYDLCSQDIVINTAPARLFDEREAARLMKEVRVIELASGKNFPDSENLVRLPGIPEKMYPTSAGRIYAQQIVKHFSKETELC